MVIQGIVILSLLTTQALCAPTGCIECSSYVNQFHTQLSGVSNHGNLVQSQLQGLDYSRPGTWTEHNDYNVNNGKVHEEKGQIVDGLKTVRYFKKNYSSSYGTRNPSGTGLLEIDQLNNNYRHGIYVPSSEDAFNSQRTYNQIGNSESIAQQHDYNRIQSQQHTQSSIRRTNSQSERLEDFGEHSGNSQVIQQSASDLNTQFLQQPSYTNTQSGNSYKTDGGQGQVFEEEGQYVTGPKKVRYYKKNYTSSYSTSNGRFAPNIVNIGEDNIHKDIENIHREIGVDNIHKDIENIHREIDKSYNQMSTVQGITSSNTAQTKINSNGDLNIDSFHRSNSDVYNRRQDYKSNLSTMNHNKQQHNTDITSEYTPQQNPSQSTYDTNTHRTYGRREGYVLNPIPTSQYINPTSGYTNVLSTGNSGYNRNTYSEGNLLQQTENLHQAENLGEHQSSHSQNHMDLDNLRQNTYSQHSLLKPVAPGRVSHYKEQWSSSHREETSLPSYSSDTLQISGQNGQYNNQYRENNFHTAHQTKLGKLVSGATDLSHIGSNDDCTQGIVKQSHVSTQYHRIYKRSAKDDKLNSEQRQKHQSDDLTQQTEDLTQKTDNFKDLAQQTSDQFQFGHRGQHSRPPIFQSWGPENFQHWTPGSDREHSEDLTQQTGDFDDLTQQISGKLQFGQQTEQSNQPWRPASASQHSEDLTQQTGEFDDLTQQTSGKLQFGQQTEQSHQPMWPGSASQHPEDLTQQTGKFDDLTPETSGKLQFGQQTEQSHQPIWPGSASQHPEDLTQQTGEFDDLTQQTSGKLQFGQQTEQSHQPWSLGNASQDAEDMTQQNEHVLQVSDINGSTGQVFPKPLAKPASKPRPRSRYSRVGSVVNLPSGSRSVQDSNNEQPSQPTNPNPLFIEALNRSTDKSADRLSELLPKVVPGTEADGTRSQDIRGDQSLDSSVNSDKTSTQKTEGNVFNIDGGGMDEGNWLHKSNDATVGLQWHYTYHPSDRRLLVQQADKKDKGDVQQQSTIPDFHDSNGNIDQQQAQDGYTFSDLYQQSSSSKKEVSGLHQQTQDDQEKVQIEYSQQTLGKTEDGLKQVGNNNPLHHLEPRILEAYGGGPYDTFHDENIYAGVTLNPSATLPEVNTADSWDVRAKPSVASVPISETTPLPLPVEPLSPDINEATPPPTFWSRIGNKITNTFDKAKEKARSIFG